MCVVYGDQVLHTGVNCNAAMEHNPTGREKLQRACSQSEKPCKFLPAADNLEIMGVHSFARPTSGLFPTRLKPCRLKAKSNPAGFRV